MDVWLSVPFGTYQRFGGFQQFDQALLYRATAAFAPLRTVAAEFYRYTADGWQISTIDDCANSEYGAWAAKVDQPGQRRLSIDPNQAAAARAVACVHLVKG